MKCPECQSVLRTVDTRQFRDYDEGYDWVERRRACPACTYRTYTVEVPRDDFHRLVNLRQRTA